MADAGYTFLPWTRRGIVAQLGNADGTAPLDARAVVRVGATITGAGDGGVDVTLLGPGDVTGIDPRLIVRTEPRPGTTAFEPNHLAAIDLDLPDLPWLVTPAAPNSNSLRPWIALVVVEQQLGVTVALEAGAPLPVLRIASPADALVELPDPSSTTLWAHSQVLAEAGISPASLPAELTDHPNENVSRLVCPRRLKPGVRYFACVVPTFDVGVVRGLGGVPAEDATLGPAWGTTRETRLPVYYHWEFATGPEGDFETLAARLRPHESSPGVGRAPMHIGAAQPGVVELPLGAPRAVVDMDGALRAPAGNDLALSEVPAPIRSGLRSAVNVAAQRAAGGTAPMTVGPPLYGSWYANRQRLTDDAPEWLRALNQDPRARVAAGLGAEMIRSNQEDLMHAAWTQLGDIRQANDRLSAARLSLEALLKVHARHLAPLPPEGLLPLVSPVHRHTLVTSVSGRVTVPAAVRPTSLPDAVLTPAMRRLTSTRRPLLRAVARRSGRIFAPAVVSRLAQGDPAVDPNRFVPDGLVGMASLDALTVPGGSAAQIDLTNLGIDGRLPAQRVRLQRQRAGRLAPMAGSRVDLRLRPTAASGGLVGADHLEAVGSLPGLTGEERVRVVSEFATTAPTLPRAAAYLLSTGRRARATIDALDLAPDGAVTIRTRPNEPNVLVGRIDPTLGDRPGGLAGVLRGLPPNTIDRTGTIRFAVRRGLGGKVIIDRGGVIGRVDPIDASPLNRVGPIGRVDPPVRPVGPTERPGRSVGPPQTGRPGVSLVVPPLLAEAAVVSRFRDAFAGLGGRLRVTDVPITPAIVAFDVTAAAAAVLQRTDPKRTVLVRIADIVRIGGADFRTSRPGVAVAPTQDRILADPRFDVPSYLYLARYDRSRFCPGIDEIPPDSVTLLETNPRFVEAFLVGLNHEMNRELLWRTYPTDQRGTAFRRFWDRFDGREDLGPIDEFGPGRLGAHLIDAEPKLVLLVRGELLRRYPTAAVYAVRSTADGRLSTAAADIANPIFGGSFEPDVTFVGFDLTDTQLDDGNGWFFVIQEQPTEPRFGLDDPASRPGTLPTTWQEAAWSDTGLGPGEHLTPAAIGMVGLGPLEHAGATAAALFQRPIRVAVHARHLVAGGT